MSSPGRAPKQRTQGLTLKLRSRPTTVAVERSAVPWGTAERIDLSSGGASGDELKKLLAGARARCLRDLCLADNKRAGSLFLQPLASNGSQLQRLQRLDISNNAVVCLDAVTRLPALQELDATGNCIERVPTSAPRMMCLRTLRIGRNKLKFLSDVLRLSDCAHLTELSIEGNRALSDLPHYRTYTVFHLRGLSVLDDDDVSLEERASAAARFGVEEVSKLKRELGTTVEHLAAMTSDQKRIARENSELESRLQEFEAQSSLADAHAQELLEKEQKLQLSTLSSELAEANARLTDADMELAYYRIESAYKGTDWSNFEPSFDWSSSPGRYIQALQEQLSQMKARVGEENATTLSATASVSPVHCSSHSLLGDDDHPTDVTVVGEQHGSATALTEDSFPDSPSFFSADNESYEISVSGLESAPDLKWLLDLLPVLGAGIKAHGSYDRLCSDAFSQQCSESLGQWSSNTDPLKLLHFTGRQQEVVQILRKEKHQLSRYLDSRLPLSPEDTHGDLELAVAIVQNCIVSETLGRLQNQYSVMQGGVADLAYQYMDASAAAHESFVDLLNCIGSHLHTKEGCFAGKQVFDDDSLQLWHSSVRKLKAVASGIEPLPSSEHFSTEESSRPGSLDQPPMDEADEKYSINLAWRALTAPRDVLADSKVAGLVQQVRVLSDENQRLSLKNAQIKEDATAMVDVLREEHAHLSQLADEELSVIRSQNNSLQQQLDMLPHERVDELQHINQQLSHKVEELEIDAARMQDKLATSVLRVTANIAADHAAELESLRSANAALAAQLALSPPTEIERLKKDCARLQAIADTVPALEHTIFELKEQSLAHLIRGSAPLEALTRENASLQQRISEMSSESVEKTRSTQEAEYALRSEIQSLQMQNADLVAQSTSLRIKHDVVELESEMIRALEKRFDSANDGDKPEESVTVVDDSTCLRNEIATLHMEFAASSRQSQWKVEELQLECDSLRAELDSKQRGEHSDATQVQLKIAPAGDNEHYVDSSVQPMNESQGLFDEALEEITQNPLKQYSKIASVLPWKDREDGIPDDLAASQLEAQLVEMQREVANLRTQNAQNATLSQHNANIGLGHSHFDSTDIADPWSGEVVVNPMPDRDTEEPSIWNSGQSEDESDLVVIRQSFEQQDISDVELLCQENASLHNQGSEIQMESKATVLNSHAQAAESQDASETGAENATSDRTAESWQQVTVDPSRVKQENKSTATDFSYPQFELEVKGQREKIDNLTALLAQKDAMHASTSRLLDALHSDVSDEHAELRALASQLHGKYGCVCQPLDSGHVGVTLASALASALEKVQFDLTLAEQSLQQHQNSSELENSRMKESVGVYARQAESAEKQYQSANAKLLTMKELLEKQREDQVQGRHRMSEALLAQEEDAAQRLACSATEADELKSKLTQLQDALLKADVALDIAKNERAAAQIRHDEALQTAEGCNRELENNLATRQGQLLELQTQWQIKEQKLTEDLEMQTENIRQQFEDLASELRCKTKVAHQELQTSQTEHVAATREIEILRKSAGQMLGMSQDALSNATTEALVFAAEAELSRRAAQDEVANKANEAAKTGQEQLASLQELHEKRMVASREETDRLKHELHSVEQDFQQHKFRTEAQLVEFKSQAQHAQDDRSRVTREMVEIKQELDILRTQTNTHAQKSRHAKTSAMKTDVVDVTEQDQKDQPVSTAIRDLLQQQKYDNDFLCREVVAKVGSAVASAVEASQSSFNDSQLLQNSVQQLSQMFTDHTDGISRDQAKIVDLARRGEEAAERRCQGLSKQLAALRSERQDDSTEMHAAHLEAQRISESRLRREEEICRNAMKALQDERDSARTSMDVARIEFEKTLRRADEGSRNLRRRLDQSCADNETAAMDAQQNFDRRQRKLEKQHARQLESLQEDYKSVLTRAQTEKEDAEQHSRELAAELALMRAEKIETSSCKEYALKLERLIEQQKQGSTTEIRALVSEALAVQQSLIEQAADSDGRIHESFKTTASLKQKLSACDLERREAERELRSAEEDHKRAMDQMSSNIRTCRADAESRCKTLVQKVSDLGQQNSSLYAEQLKLQTASTVAQQERAKLSQQLISVQSEFECANKELADLRSAFMIQQDAHATSTENATRQFHVVCQQLVDLKNEREQVLGRLDHQAAANLTLERKLQHQQIHYEETVNAAHEFENAARASESTLRIVQVQFAEIQQQCLYYEDSCHQKDEMIMRLSSEEGHDKQLASKLSPVPTESVKYVQGSTTLASNIQVQALQNAESTLQHLQKQFEAEERRNDDLTQEMSALRQELARVRSKFAANYTVAKPHVDVEQEDVVKHAQCAFEHQLNTMKVEHAQEIEHARHIHDQALARAQSATSDVQTRCQMLSTQLSELRSRELRISEELSAKSAEMDDLSRQLSAERRTSEERFVTMKEFERQLEQQSKVLSDKNANYKIVASELDALKNSVAVERSGFQEIIGDMQHQLDQTIENKSKAMEDAQLSFRHHQQKLEEEQARYVHKLQHDHEISVSAIARAQTQAEERCADLMSQLAQLKTAQIDRSLRSNKIVSANLLITEALGEASSKLNELLASEICNEAESLDDVDEHVLSGHSSTKASPLLLKLGEVRSAVLSSVSDESYSDATLTLSQLKSTHSILDQVHQADKSHLIAGANQRVAKLNAQLCEARIERAQLQTAHQSTMATAKSQREQTEADVRQLEEELIVAKDRAQRAEQAAGESIHIAEQVEVREEAAQSAREEMQEQVSALSAALATARSEHSAQLAQLTVKLAWQEEDATQLREQLKIVQEKYEVACKQLAAERATQQVKTEQLQQANSRAKNESAALVDTVKKREEKIADELHRERVKCQAVLRTLQQERDANFTGASVARAAVDENKKHATDSMQAAEAAQESATEAAMLRATDATREAERRLEICHEKHKMAMADAQQSFEWRERKIKQEHAHQMRDLQQSHEAALAEMRLAVKQSTARAEEVTTKRAQLQITDNAKGSELSQRCRALEMELQKQDAHIRLEVRKQTMQLQQSELQSRLELQRLQGISRSALQTLRPGSQAQVLKSVPATPTTTPPMSPVLSSAPHGTPWKTRSGVTPTCTRAVPDAIEPGRSAASSTLDVEGLEDAIISLRSIATELTTVVSEMEQLRTLNVADYSAIRKGIRVLADADAHVTDSSVISAVVPLREGRVAQQQIIEMVAARWSSMGGTLRRRLLVISDKLQQQHSEHVTILSELAQGNRAATR